MQIESESIELKRFLKHRADHMWDVPALKCRYNSSLPRINDNNMDVEDDNSSPKDNESVTCPNNDVIPLRDIQGLEDDNDDDVDMSSNELRTIDDALVNSPLGVQRHMILIIIWI